MCRGCEVLVSTPQTDSVWQLHGEAAAGVHSQQSQHQEQQLLRSKAVLSPALGCCCAVTVPRATAEGSDAGIGWCCGVSVGSSLKHFTFEVCLMGDF